MSQLGTAFCDFVGVCGAGVTSAWLLPPSDDDVTAVPTVALRTSLADHVTNKSRTLLSYARPGKAGWTRLSTFPTEMKGVTAAYPSPSGRFLVTLRPGDDDANATVVELWDGATVVSSVNTGTAHGQVMGQLVGGLCWTPDESCVVYSAALLPAGKPTEWWAPPGPDTLPGTKRDFTQDWGEGYGGVRSSGLFIVSFALNTVSPVRGVPKEVVLAGQPVSTPQGGLVYTGWPLPAPHRKLGITYCMNRPCALYYYDLATQIAGGEPAPHIQLTTDTIAQSPVVAAGPCEATVFYLASPPMHTHAGSLTIKLLHLPLGEVSPGAFPSRVLVDTVARADASTFPGVFADRLPQRGAFLRTPDAEYVFFTTNFRSRETVMSVHVADGALTDLGASVASAFPASCPPSVSFLDSSTQGVCVSVSTPSSPPTPAFLPLPLPSPAVVMPWRPSLLSPARVETHKQLVGLRTALLQVTPSTADVDGHKDPFEVIMVLPGGPGPLPLLLIPHGGPHSAFSTAFIAKHAFFASQGIAVCAVNYRGSLGFGTQPLTALLGRIGRQDVDDVSDALAAALAAYPTELSPERCVVFGGSHGGFLALHLAAQTPRAFKGCIARNPVFNISSMQAATDIPDWCRVEPGLPPAITTPPTPDQLLAMYAASPIAHVDKVVCPVLLLVGGEDKRVPPFQSYEALYYLQARGVPVRMSVYGDDSHGLTRPQTEFDLACNIVQCVREWVGEAPL